MMRIMAWWMETKRPVIRECLLSHRKEWAGPVVATSPFVLLGSQDLGAALEVRDTIVRKPAQRISPSRFPPLLQSPRIQPFSRPVTGAERRRFLATFRGRLNAALAERAPFPLSGGWFLSKPWDLADLVYKV